MGVEGVDVVKHPRHLARVVEHDHSARTSHRSARGERVEVELDVPEIQLTLTAVGILELEGFVAAQNLRRRSSGDHRLERASVLGSATHIIEQLTHGELADLDFEIAGIFHIARHTKNASAGVAGHAELGVLVTAHADDVFHMAERLNIVDDRRAHVETERGREIRRLDARVRTLAFEGFDQTRFLAADVSTGTTVDIQFKVKARTENVFADEIFRARLFDRTLYDKRRFGKLLTQVNVSRVRADSKGGDDHALNELMRILMKDVTILEGSRLGLVAIANQIHWLSVVRRNEGPLHSRRKSRTTPAAQAGFFHLFDDVLRRHRHRLAQIFIPAVAHVAVNRRIPSLAIDILEDEPVLAGVRLLGVGDHAGGRKLSHDGPMLKHETAGNAFFGVLLHSTASSAFHRCLNPEKPPQFSPIKKP